MSYWVYLQDEKNEPVKVKKHQEGGTYAVGGVDKAELNITYNYGKYYRKYLNRRAGLRWLNNKNASEVIKKLEQAVKELGIQRAEDYWEATSGNAGYALAILLSWARQYPDAKFYVS